MNISVEKSLWCFLRYNFTYEARLGLLSSSGTKAALEEKEALFLGDVEERVGEEGKTRALCIESGFKKEKNIRNSIFLERKRIKENMEVESFINGAVPSPKVPGSSHALFHLQGLDMCQI